MFKIINLLFLLLMQLYANISSYTITPSKEYKSKSITILDAKELDFSDVHELSGLAYEDDTLYALSDRGILYCQAQSKNVPKRSLNMYHFVTLI